MISKLELNKHQQVLLAPGLVMADTIRDREEALLLDEHLNLLRKSPREHTLPELRATPIFVMPILRYAETLLAPSDLQPFPQHGLLGGLANVLKVQEETGRKLYTDSTSKAAMTKRSLSVRRII
ncbi:hypothetical protein WAI453_004299 [Rhynchosporium graminicola]